MDQNEVMRHIVELGCAGGALPTEEALRVVVAMIDRLDPHSESFELDVAAMMRVGATVWALSHGTPAPEEGHLILPPVMR